jgi:hypothetical protein
MQVTFFLAVLILLSYTIFLVIKFGVLPSFSDSWYALQKIGLEPLFPAVLSTVSMLMLITMFDLTQGLWWQFVSLFVCFPLLYVAVARAFKIGGLESAVHKYAAILSGIASIVWVILASTSIAPNAWMNIPVMAVFMALCYYANKQQNGLWWAEYASFGWLIMSVGVAISWR